MPHKLIFIALIIICFFNESVEAQNNTIEKLIEKRIENGESNNSVFADDIILFSQIELPKFYTLREDKLGWTNKKDRDDLMMNLRLSFDEGLDPNDYHLEKITALLNKSNYKKLNTQDVVDLDFLLTDALILYASHLISGKVEQSKLRSKWNVELNKRPEHIDSLLVITLQSHKVNAALENLKPKHYLYNLMKFNLKVYREIEKNGGWPKIKEGETLKKGMTDERIISIRKYLTVTKDLKQNNDPENTLYSDELERGVMKFQTRHYLSSDGVIGKGTLEQMNVSITDRIDMIRINLERMRWVFHEPDDDFLLVNIAGYYVKRFTHGEEVFSSRVIVGKYHKETPIFKGVMQYIVLNPTWTLPYSIATRETLPKLKKNPGYLADKHMIIMDKSGKVLDPSTIDFSEYSAGNFPFTVRQKAGPWNALGQVKFIFPNKNAIYLHDTPSKSLFNSQDRAFSHGCIRTESKWELLMSLMDDPEVWNMNKINEILDSGKTTRINLPKPINIYLMYWTARVDQENILYFMKDVYKRDPAVIKALDMPYVFKTAN